MVTYIKLYIYVIVRAISGRSGMRVLYTAAKYLQKNEEEETDRQGEANRP